MLYDRNLCQKCVNGLRSLKDLSNACENDECIMIASYLLQYADKIPRMMEIHFHVTIAFESTDWHQVQEAINNASALITAIEIVHQENGFDVTPHLRLGFERMKACLYSAQELQDLYRPAEHEIVADRASIHHLIRKLLVRERKHMDIIVDNLTREFGAEAVDENFAFH
jgi:hypothetical protein